MSVNPAWHFAGGFDGLDLPRFWHHSVNRRESLSPLLWISQAADNVDSIRTQGGGMKIGRWKNFSGISVDLKIAPIVNHDIVINVKIRVVVILMLARNLHESAVAERSQR